MRGFESLERRDLPATFVVTSLAADGAGSLRAAIAQANTNPGPDTIDFGISGTIQVGRTPLPKITDTIAIDGTSAPGYAGQPVVTVDYQSTRGLWLDQGSDGSLISSLALVHASDAGLTLIASNITVAGNFIGLLADGTTPAGNAGDGIRITPYSHGDLIGHDNPVSSIDYYDASGVSMQPVTAWQGIRSSDVPGQYLITGTSNTNGLLYVGPISGSGGVSYSVNYPGAVSTSVYGPDTVGPGIVRLVGSYNLGDGSVHGFVYEGPVSDLSNPANYSTVDGAGAQYTYMHSSMGDLVVGNSDGPEGNLPLGTGHALLYNVAQHAFLPDIVYPGSTTTTAYGIWYNGLDQYTICGGYSDPLSSPGGLSHAFLVDYNARTGQYSNWTSFDAPAGPLGQSFITHFQGISSEEKGVYTLAADSAQIGATTEIKASLVTVRRNPDGTFAPAVWVDLNTPGGSGVTSANSVAGNKVVGVVFQQPIVSFQASVNTSFQRSNVISANGGNGIGVYGAVGNHIAMNEIGTDASGMMNRGNAQNGILLAHGAFANLIGGQSTGGNDPTASVFVRPPQGNLISGNGANGVLILDRSSWNLLSGNFVGTDATGNAPLGNRLDGVAIVNADFNQLIGCTFQQDPFVFYNVLSGNGGNGLRITDSNNTTVQANFMGAGANNATVVANGGDGLLVSGTSRNTQVGGVIPLGNVIAGNNRNGIEVRDQARGFISFNTFAGIFAFAGAAPNRNDGILITSSGGNNVVRTCIVSGNLGNGIEIGGNAVGVQVTDTAIGTNTEINAPIPNLGNGILITGNAHGITIGGFQASIEPQVTVSANLGYGLKFAGNAHNNLVFDTYIGTDFNGQGSLGNALGGILLGPGTYSNTIGGANPALGNVIRNNRLGILIQSSNNNRIFGNMIQGNLGPGVIMMNSWLNQIGGPFAGNLISQNGGSGIVIVGCASASAIQGNQVVGNAGDGIQLINAQKLLIGGTHPGAGNTIIGNQQYGVSAVGYCGGTRVIRNTINFNAAGNLDLSRSRGILYVP